jgi:aspartyl-tRNA(Asn)/glutamyl-tRNA(Gln) amidotransferase subunit A
VELYRHPYRELRAMLASGELSATEVVRAHLDRIVALEDQLGAFVKVLPARSIQLAEELDRKHGSLRALPPLFGAPVVLKDNLCLEGVATTCCSRILEGFAPPYSATVVQRLLSAGAVVLAKSNMDEFAMGSSTENSAFKVTRNPWNPNQVPGGSSGGSAAAVAAGMTPLALGSDTGGSVRQPAALCGVLGLKPTYGRVSRYGLVAFASSLDQIGPLARDVEDLALLLGVIAGHDPCDSTSAAEPVPDYVAQSLGGVKGLRVGVPPECFGAGVDPEVAAQVRRALTALRSAGAREVEIHLPHTRYAIATYYLICTAEASSNLARYDGVRYGFRAPGYDDLETMMARTRSAGFGREVKRRIMLGTYALSAGYYDAYYKKAQQVRTLIRRDFQTAFESCDLVLTPTTPTPAFARGEKVEDPLQMYLSDIFTVTANLAGLPALSVPVGFSSGGLPIGAQLTGPPFAEGLLLKAARLLEEQLAVEPKIAPLEEE